MPIVVRSDLSRVNSPCTRAHRYFQPVPNLADPDALLRQVVRIIERERLDQGMTQHALASLSGITQSTVSKYLRVQLRLNLSQFDAMCAVLGLSPARVMEEADSKRYAK
jgi:ribosome-binding protein aMBF1 (putative translation factor)